MRQGGFTLVEILLVLLILGIGLSMASVNLGVLDQRNQQDEIERLSRVLQFAAERAAVRASPLRIEFLPASYRFSQLDASGKWQLIFSPAELTEHAWPKGLHLQALSLDGITQTTANPAITFGAESPPFQLSLHSDSGEQRIQGNSAGEVRLLEAGAPW